MFKHFITIFVLIFFNTQGYSSISGRVLVLNSYHPDYKWTADTMKGIESVLQKHPAIHTSVEYMDTKRASSDEYFKHLFDIYEMKYSKISFDLIICSDNDSLRFLKIYRDKLFHGTPVVFCGINNFTPSDISGMKNITGVNEDADIKDTIDLALKLQPETKMILIVNDATTTGERLEKTITDINNNYYKKIEFRFLKGTLSEIFKSISEADRHSFILFTVFSIDTAGNYFDYKEVIQRLRYITPVPVYGLWDFHLGFGLTGGKLMSGFYQGKTAADLALRILNGESADSIPVVVNSPNRFMFDYNELSKYNLDIAALPVNSIIINNKPTFYEYYELHQVFFIITTISVFIVVFSLLMIIIVRERRNKKKSIHSENMLRSILDSITEAMFIIKPDGLLVDANAEAENRLNLSDGRTGNINIFDYFPENVTQKRMEYIKLVIDTKMPVSFTDERNGIVLLNNIYPIMDDSGEVDLLSIASSDITFMKRNEELFNNIIANAPMGVIYVTIEGSIVLANSIAESILYLSKNDNKGRYEKIEGTPDVPFIKGNTIGWPLTLVIESGRALYSVESIIEREGNYKQYLSLNVAPIRDIYEKLAGLVVMIVDATDVKTMQMELTDSKDKLSNILESINDGFFAINREGILTYVNSQAEEIWGLNAERIVGKPVEKVFKRMNYPSIYTHFDLALQNDKYSQLEHHESSTKKWFMLHFYPYSDGISVYFTDITYRKELEFKLKEMALTDVLTGVLNRRAGISIIEKSILSTAREHKPLTICFMDVDGLKSVNDKYGHNEGDRLLTDVSKTICSIFRGSDNLCRLGGDEFLAILPGCGIDQTFIIRERILSSLKKANEKKNHEYPLEVSIGFALYPPEGKLSADEFIALADAEMYKEKQDKKSHRV